jgi:hypothetical protein
VYKLLTGLDQALISQWYKEKFKITQTFLLLISPLYSRGEIAAAEFHKFMQQLSNRHSLTDDVVTYSAHAAGLLHT